MSPMVPGLILAAGASTRMGRPKALLPCGESGLPFVSSLILALREGGVAEVLVVGRPADEALRLEVENRGGRFVENPRPADGQLSSLVAGLNAADRPGVRGLLVIPVDVPLVTGAIVATLLREFHRSAPAVVRAVHRGRHGHPVVFSRTVFDELRRADPAVGAKAVVHAHADDLQNVEVGSEAVLTDVDTPEDYDGVFGKFR
jgi:molybdenum cofactor cytidylyltransferase